jgi:tetratricopeptide (TPR) repeat protein
VPSLAGGEQALAWARAERASLLDCLDHAIAGSQHVRAIALTAGLAGLLRLDGPWAEAITRHQATIEAARQAGDRLSHANALHDLGDVRWLMGEYRAAAQDLEQALGILRNLGHRGGEVQALNERGMLHRVSGDVAQAEGCHRQALNLARTIGSSWDEAHALAGLGRCALAAHQATRAQALLRQALEIFQRIGAAEAGEVSRELTALTKAGPPA